MTAEAEQRLFAKLYRVFRHLALLCEQEFNGSVTVQFANGVPRNVRSEAVYEPDRLPGSDEAAIAVLAQLQAEANK